MENDASFIPITEDGVVTKQIIKEGYGILPEIGSICHAKVIPSMNVFDSCYNLRDRREDFTFEVGLAFDETVLTMKKGEVCLMRTGPSHAFGKLGCPPRIPGNVTIQYEIELISFEGKKQKAFKTIEQRIKEAEKFRLEGNEHFKKGHHRKATKCYNHALSQFGALKGDISEEDQLRVNAAMLPLYLNQAACDLKRSDIPKAIRNSRLALEIDPDNPKGHFRLAQAYLAEDEMETAKEHILRAIRLDPQNRDFRQEWEQIQRRTKEKIEEDKHKPNPFRGMFGTGQ